MAAILANLAIAGTAGAQPSLTPPSPAPEVAPEVASEVAAAAVAEEPAPPALRLSAGLASEVVSDGARGLLTVSATYRDDGGGDLLANPTSWSIDAGAQVAADVTRDGAGGTAAGNVVARADVEPDAGNTRTPLELTGWFALAGRPSLADPRRGLRDTSTGAGGTVSFPLVVARTERGAHHVVLSRVGGSTTVQGGHSLSEVIWDTTVYAYCRARRAHTPFCVDAFVFDATGVYGVDEAVLVTLYPVRLLGIPLVAGFSLDAAGGVIGNDAKMTASENGQPVAELTTNDLPVIGAGAWDLRLAGAIGAAGVELASRRTGWVSLEGDMTIEDRASAAITGRAGATSFAVTGFAATTRWWTSRDDPGSVANTGGAELALGRRVAGFDVVVSGGVARTFYATLDGGSPTTPALGFRGGVSIQKALLER